MADEITQVNIRSVEPYEGPNSIPGVGFRPAGAALGVSAWGMNVIDIDAGVTGYPRHSHAKDGQEEVYVVMSGAGTLETDGGSHAVNQGDMVRVPSDVERHWTAGGEGITLLALGGTPGEPYTPGMGG
ncbi:MAG: cupin domain-containing protein [Thermoleophilia bacterium]|nr:cupin domain-containing protein [Thermoleophilia bacterium]